MRHLIKITEFLKLLAKILFMPVQLVMALIVVFGLAIKLLMMGDDAMKRDNFSSV